MSLANAGSRTSIPIFLNRKDSTGTDSRVTTSPTHHFDNFPIVSSHYGYFLWRSIRFGIDNDTCIRRPLVNKMPEKTKKLQKILLINPFASYAEGTNPATVYPPMGLGYIASVLEQKGYTCRIIDAGVLQLQPDEILKDIRSWKPNVIGITTNIVTARAAVELGTFLHKKFPHALYIYGGPYATAQPSHVLTETNGDIIVRGEGEETIVETLSLYPKLTTVKGISFQKNRKIIHNSDRPLILDLDTIPFPAYHLFPSFHLYKSRSRANPIGCLMSSRGCPYQCIYCNSNIFGKRFRMRSPDNVLAEIELLVKQYHVKQIDVLDDNFTLNIERAETILTGVIDRSIHVLFNFQNGIRADRLTPKLAHIMKLAGVYKAGIGVESGDLRIQKIIKKSLSLPAVVRAVRLLRKEHIITTCFFMIGLPGETPKTLDHTIDFALKVNPHMANFSVVVPLPETELYRIIKEKGKFIQSIDAGSQTGFYTNNFYFEIGQVNQKLIQKYVSKAYRKFYFRLPKIIDMFSTIKSWSELRWIIDTTMPILKFVCK